MILVDTREPDSIALKIGKDGISIPKDEQLIKIALPAGDILITRFNGQLPTNMAQYAVMAGHLGVTYEVEKVLENVQQAALFALMSQSVVVERKTPSDFLNSIKDGRLFDQAMRLVEHCKYPIILITGFFYESNDHVIIMGKETGWNWWSVQMSILRLQYAGCGVMMVAPKHMEQVVAHLYRWLYEGRQEVRRKPVSPLIPISEEAEFLCGLPGIGPDRAKDVLAYAGTPANALHFLSLPNAHELPNRPFGIGKQVIARVRGFLQLGEEESLGINFQEGK